MTSCAQLFDSYGAWFSGAKLELLDDDELNYCLQVNFQLGDWLLHFHGHRDKVPEVRSLESFLLRVFRRITP